MSSSSRPPPAPAPQHPPTAAMATSSIRDLPFLLHQISLKHHHHHHHHLLQPRQPPDLHLHPHPSSSSAVPKLSHLRLPSSPSSINGGQISSPELLSQPWFLRALSLSCSSHCGSSTPLLHLRAEQPRELPPISQSWKLSCELLFTPISISSGASTRISSDFISPAATSTTSSSRSHGDLHTCASSSTSLSLCAAPPRSPLRSHQLLPVLSTAASSTSSAQSSPTAEQLRPLPPSPPSSFGSPTSMAKPPPPSAAPAVASFVSFMAAHHHSRGSPIPHLHHCSELLHLLFPSSEPRFSSL